MITVPFFYRFVGLFVCFVAFGACFCQAAHFEAVHQSTYCDSNAIVQTTSEGPYEDPQGNWSGATGSNSSNSYSSIEEISDAYSDTSIDFGLSSFRGYEDGYEASISLNASSESMCWAGDPDCVLTEAFADAYTSDGGSATGNFYRIVPDDYEQEGDLVTIRIDYGSMVELMDGDPYSGIYEATISGGAAGDDLLITLNCQDYDNPQESEILHRIAKLELGYGETGNYDDDSVSYQVHIGDIIGIHAGLSSYVELNGENYFDCIADLGLEVIIDSLDAPGPFNPDRADMDGSGLTDLADLDKLAIAWLWEGGLTMLITSDVSFESPDDLTQLGGSASSLWTWNAAGGISNSGCAEPYNSTDYHSLILTDSPVDLTIADQTYTVSMMFKRWNTEYVGVDEAQAGFVAGASQDLYTSAGPFMSVKLSASGTDTLRMDLNFRDAAGGGYMLSKSLASGIVLDDGHWYNFRVTFQKLAGSDWRVTADLDDYGMVGAGMVGPVVTGVTTTFTCGLLYTDTEAYVAISAERNDYASAGAQYVDNFSVTYCPFDPLMADLSRNGKVDMADFALFASAWLLD